MYVCSDLLVVVTGLSKSRIVAMPCITSMLLLLCVKVNEVCPQSSQHNIVYGLKCTRRLREKATGLSLDSAVEVPATAKLVKCISYFKFHPFFVTPHWRRQNINFCPAHTNLVLFIRISVIQGLMRYH